MRAVLFVIGVVFSSLVLTSPASAETKNSISIDQAQPVLQREFDFRVYSNCVGCMSFGNYSSVPTFPFINGGVVAAVRFYINDRSFKRVTLNSPYIELRVGRDNYGGYVLADGRLGNLKSGSRYFVKVALVDDTGRIIYYPVDGESDPMNHSVVIQ